ncbi:unnamed protein product [Amoebophrya sp. A120]|nr:unnamed protein product [Amoebophrya sp. A120]|eukprot:GSA120T00018831001.1
MAIMNKQQIKKEVDRASRNGGNPAQLLTETERSFYLAPWILTLPQDADSFHDRKWWGPRCLLCRQPNGWDAEGVALLSAFKHWDTAHARADGKRNKCKRRHFARSANETASGSVETMNDLLQIRAEVLALDQEFVGAEGENSILGHPDNQLLHPFFHNYQVPDRAAFLDIADDLSATTCRSFASIRTRLTRNEPADGAQWNQQEKLEEEKRFARILLRLRPWTTDMVDEEYDEEPGEEEEQFELLHMNNGPRGGNDSAQDEDIDAHYEEEEEPDDEFNEDIDLRSVPMTPSSSGIRSAGAMSAAMLRAGISSVASSVRAGISSVSSFYQQAPANPFMVNSNEETFSAASTSSSKPPGYYMRNQQQPRREVHYGSVNLRQAGSGAPSSSRGNENANNRTSANSRNNVASSSSSYRRPRSRSRSLEERRGGKGKNRGGRNYGVNNPGGPGASSSNRGGGPVRPR